MRLNPKCLEEKIHTLLDAFNIEDVIEFDNKLDDSFGLKTQEVGAGEYGEDPYYLGLAKPALLTSYLDYYKILTSLPQDSTLVDLGAGFCRGTLLSSYLNLADVISIEAVEARTKVAKQALERMEKQNGEIRCLDLFNVDLPRADAYYLYLPSGRLLDRILASLMKIGGGRKVFVCESHGDVLTYVDQLEIFKRTSLISLSMSRHVSEISVYETLDSSFDHISWSSNFPLWFVFNQHNDYVVVFNYLRGKCRHEWVIPIADLEQGFSNGQWTLRDTRTKRFIAISKEESVLRVLASSSLSSKLHLIIKNRAQYQKVFMAPELMVETRSGEFKKIN